MDIGLAAKIHKHNWPNKTSARILNIIVACVETLSPQINSHAFRELQLTNMLQCNYFSCKLQAKIYGHM